MDKQSLCSGYTLRNRCIGVNIISADRSLAEHLDTHACTKSTLHPWNGDTLSRVMIAIPSNTSIYVIYIAST